MLFLELFGYLLLILVAAEVFVNALEHLGEKLHISEGVTGSLFAAVGTAMPETLVPLLAIFATSGDAATNEEIGVGAILGAPLMLSTLSLFLMGLAVVARRGVKGHLTPEKGGLKRDLDFFLLAFVFAFVAMFVPHEAGWVRAGIAFVMVMIYFFYVMLTLRASAKLVEEGHATEAGAPMLLTRVGLPQNLAVIVAQLGLGLCQRRPIVPQAGALTLGLDDCRAGEQPRPRTVHRGPRLALQEVRERTERGRSSRLRLR
jgi:cation:H+ antiporter